MNLLCVYIAVAQPISVKTIKYMVAWGIDINGVDGKSRNALHIALDSAHSDFNIIETLIDLGICVTQVDSNGRSAIEKASE